MTPRPLFAVPARQPGPFFCGDRYLWPNTLPPPPVDDIEKHYFTIGEVARQLGVSTSLVRFWETEFPELRPRKNQKGNRTYRQADLALLREIYHLVRERGHTLPGARQELKLRQQAATDRAAVVRRLRELRAFLVEMRDQLPPS